MRVDPVALDRALTLPLQAKFEEELDCPGEVGNHDADVIHPLNGHVRGR